MCKTEIVKWTVITNNLPWPAYSLINVGRDLNRGFRGLALVAAGGVGKNRKYQLHHFLRIVN